MQNRLTVLTTTNFVPSCPSTALLEGVIESFNRKFGVEEYDHFIFYDRPRQESLDDQRYLDNLRRLDERFPSKIEIFSERFVGLRGGWLRLFEEIRTPYALFLEHDWHFTDAPVPPLAALLDAFDRHPFLNYLRFNKMNGTTLQWEHWDRRHELEERVPELELTRVWSWSNNPHLCRTRMIIDKCVPIVSSRPFIGALDPAWQGWPCGVEGLIRDAIDRDVQQHGFAEAHREWGTYFVGAPNSANTVHHVCGRSFLG